MKWEDVRKQHEDRWLVIEALSAHTEGERRILDDIAVVALCSNGAAAMDRYRQLHKENPDREFYFVNTAREALDIRVRQWLGIRATYADNPAR